MRETLKALMRDPSTGADLELVAFESNSTSDGVADVVEGILFDAAKGSAYPIVGGVPSMIDDAFTPSFLAKHREAIAEHPGLSRLTLRPGPESTWSFTKQWDEYFDSGGEDGARTWGYTAQERIEQFHLETEVDAEWVKGKMVLDAGCGNGVLSAEIGKLGANVVGLDYAGSVFECERRRSLDGLHFVQGDLSAPPLPPESFDLAISIGVLMCTPDTYKSFSNVARLVKPGGKLYVWVYRRPEGFIGRHIKVPIYDLMRVIISRMSPKPQEIAVKAYARLVRFSHNLRDRNNPIPLHEYVVSAYDDLALFYRRYHTPFNLSRWFNDCGFGAPTLSHWDSPYGFGVVATKHQPGTSKATPGIHYGEGPRLWDEDKTVLGKLHWD